MGWSHRAANYYLKFLAPSTLMMYNNYINMFHAFCIENQYNIPNDLCCGSAVVAEFMCYKAEKSERPESMLTSILAALTALNSAPLPKYLYNLKIALIKECTKRPKGRTPVMPIKRFVDMFEKWGENDSITLKQLRQKCMTLMALCIMCRPSDLILSRDRIIFNVDGTVTFLFFGIKNDMDRKGFEVRLQPSHYNEICDPIKCLNEYMTRTKHLTQENGPLFLSLRPPHGAVSIAVVSEILKDSIVQSGLDTKIYTPRCFRPSGATAAVRAGNDPEITRQLGRWKTRDVFYDNYVYPRPEKTFTDNVLSSNVIL